MVKTHDPFIVNDLWFARETGVDPAAVNLAAASSTGTRSVRQELAASWSSSHALVSAAAAAGCFAGCATGDTGAALVVERG